MREGTATVNFFDDIAPSDTELLQAVGSVCHELGFRTTNDEPVSEDRPERNEQGGIQLLWNDEDIPSAGRVGFTFGTGGIEGDDVANYMNIHTPIYLITTETDSGEYTGFPGTFVKLIRRLSCKLDPVYVLTHSSMMARDGLLPRTFYPINRLTDIERLPWLGVYADPLIEQFGGRERVLNTPAWKVEELDNGSILIILMREPWGEQRAKYLDRQPADRYLLDGEAL